MKFRISVLVVLASTTACGGSTDSGSSTGGGSGASGTGANQGTGAISGTGGTIASGGGSGSGASGGTGGSGGSVVPEPGPFTGTWKGYVENYTFSDNTDVVTMTLDAVEAQVAGHVTFGDSPPLAPPTDPNVGYPPPGSSGNPGGIPYVEIKPTPGFAYAIGGGSFDGQRLKFTLALHELYKPWCEMQTPIADEVNAGNYSCVPNWAGGGIDGKCFFDNPETGEKVWVDCGKVALCQTVCQCTAQACSVTLSPGPAFDMQLNPPNADGSVAGFDGNVRNVHLKHQ